LGHAPRAGLLYSGQMSSSSPRMSLPRLPTLDQLCRAADTALRTVFTQPHASRSCPTVPERTTELSPADKAHAGALMRVNHVGEVCAQALYTAQALVTKSPALRSHFLHAADEETDHLAWTRQRLDELGAHPSVLNPLWYAGAFGLGLAAGQFGGDRWSLGFVVETENQVAAHLQSHLEHLPADDHASRAIVVQMKDDEERHAQQATLAGALDLPAPVKTLMTLAAKVMTTVAHRI
jgi:ubiquinone biosynthesis monooxygenase Coq7